MDLSGSFSSSCHCFTKRLLLQTRPVEVSIGEDAPELLRGLEAGEAGLLCDGGVACGGTAGLTNLSCETLIRER